MPNVGYATLTVIPSMKGMGVRLNQEWAKVSGAPAAAAGAASGKAYGQGMSNAAEGIARGTSSQVTAILGTALKGGAVALAAAGAYGLYKASQAASEFETRISAVGAVSGASAAELDTLRAKSLQLGADTSFSASESAGAIEELVKAGLSVPDVMNGAADATVALAAAGEIDLTQAATIASNALNAFKLTAADLPNVADTIAGAANTSAIDVEELGLSMQQASAVASLVGLSLEDTATAIGLLGDAGIRGSDAGTSLKTMLQRLTPQTKAQAEAMSELGLLTEEGTSRFFDQSGEVKSLAEVADLLQGALAGMGREQQIATLQTLFGTDAIRAAAIVAGEGAAGVNEFSTAMGAIDAEDVAAQRLDNLAGDFEQLGGSIETLLIKGGTPFNTWLRELVQAGTAATDWLADPPEGFTDWLADMASTAETRLLPIWDDLYGTGENIVDILGQMVDVGGPVVMTLAGIGGSAVLGALSATAGALEGITGFLAENEWAVRAVMASTTAWAALQAWPVIVGAVETVYIRWLALQGAVAGSTIVGGLQMIGGGFLTMGTNAGIGAGMVRGGMATIAGSTIAATAGLGLVAYAGWTVVQSIQKSNDAAKAWRDEVEADINPRSVESYRDALDQAKAKAQESLGALEEMGVVGGGAFDKVRAGLRAQLELTTWMKDSTLTSSDALEQAAASAEIWGRRLAELEGIVAGVATELDTTGPSVEAWMEKLELDPSEMGVDEIAAAIRDAKLMAEEGAPATDTLAEAYNVLANETSSATDQLDAWKDAMDAVIGVQVDMNRATDEWAKAIPELTYTLAGLGSGLDGMSTEAIDSRLAIQDMVDRAVEMAATLGQTGQIEEATFALAANRNQIIEAGIAAGISRAEMEGYLEKLGLTPENISTGILVEGVPEAEGIIGQTTRDRTVRIGMHIDAPTGPGSGLLARLGYEGSIPIPGFASGGPIPGPNVNRDIVPAMLTPGEYVITKEAAKRIGYPALEALNAGQIPGFNRGGRIFEDQPGWNWRTMGNRRASAEIAAMFPNGLLGDTNQSGRLEPGEWERWRSGGGTGSFSGGSFSGGTSSFSGGRPSTGSFSSRPSSMRPAGSSSSTGSFSGGSVAVSNGDAIARAFVKHLAPALRTIAEGHARGASEREIEADIKFGMALEGVT